MVYKIKAGLLHFPSRDMFNVICGRANKYFRHKLQVLPASLPSQTNHQVEGVPIKQVFHRYFEPSNTL